jgi:hypothetical protein
MHDVEFLLLCSRQFRHESLILHSACFASHVDTLVRLSWGRALSSIFYAHMRNETNLAAITESS